jgi:hypothetical protein
LDQLLPIWHHVAVIYIRLFKYTKQHTAGFTENNWALHLPRPILFMTTLYTVINDCRCTEHVFNRHDITEILLKVVLNTINPNQNTFCIKFVIPWQEIPSLKCLSYGLVFLNLDNQHSNVIQLEINYHVHLSVLVIMT